MLLVEELYQYKDVFKDFCQYIEKELKMPYKVFLSKANNATAIPQLINYIESQGIDFLDVLCYVNFNINGSLSYNELCKKSIRTVFYMIDKKIPLIFIPF